MSRVYPVKGTLRSSEEIPQVYPAALALSNEIMGQGVWCEYDNGRTTRKNYTTD
jgi:hypothetical protein